MQIEDIRANPATGTSCAMGESALRTLLLVLRRVGVRCLENSSSPSLPPIRRKTWVSANIHASLSGSYRQVGSESGRVTDSQSLVFWVAASEHPGPIYVCDPCGGRHTVHPSLLRLTASPVKPTQNPEPSRISRTAVRPAGCSADRSADRCC